MKKSGGKPSRKINQNMNYPLTEKEKKVFKFLRSYTIEKGYSPTMAEIGAKFKVTAQMAFKYLSLLEKKEVIKRIKIKNTKRNEIKFLITNI